MLTTIKAAFAQNAVLVFRDQDVTDEQQIAFSECFGDLEATKVGTPGAGGASGDGGGPLRHPRGERCLEADHAERTRPRLWWEIARWIVAGRGLLAFSPAHVAGFERSRPELDFPDLQLMFTPASYAEGVTGSLQRTPGMTAGFWPMRPESRGYVRAWSADPSEAPAIQPNYLATETDMQVAIAGVRWCRSLLATRALAPYRADETLPGADCQSDDEILTHVRRTGATVYHAIGTCRMSADPMAVVDDRLRVRGVDGLRVIDASIMPSMPSVNTNAATLMIAEKGSDFILAED